MLIPGYEDPTRTERGYAGSIRTPYGPVVEERKQETYTQPTQSLSLGDGRHKELMDGLKEISSALKTKSTEALKETRPWRG